MPTANPPSPGAASAAAGLARACHPAPTVGVTLLTVLLGVVAGVTGPRLLLLGSAVLAGQLTIGWSNDLVDAGRDRRVGRADKPIATGELAARTVLVALGTAVAATVLASALLGWRVGLLHLVGVVGSGWAYNLVLKGTVWSWAPYAVAFGLLPAVAWVSAGPGAPFPPAWVMAAGALLGVGAHLVNTLPDFADDEMTGVRGLPHRLGRRATGTSAVVILGVGTAVALLGPGLDGGLTRTPAWAWVTLLVVAAGAVGAIRRGGRAPFRMAIVIALVNVLVLLVRP